MTLREAVNRVDEILAVMFFAADDVEALKLVLEAARDRLEDTAEIPLPTGGK